MLRRTTILFALAALLPAHPAFAVDSSSSNLLLEEEGGVETYELPKLKTEAELHVGYRVTDIDGSHESAEYEYLKNSLLFGGNLRFANSPHRLHLDFDFRNEKDYFGDAWYAYKDLLLIRSINSTFFHNLRLTCYSSNRITISHSFTKYRHMRINSIIFLSTT